MGSDAGSGSGKLAAAAETRSTHEETLVPSQVQRPDDDPQQLQPQNLAELPASQVTRTGPSSHAGSSKSKRASGSYYEDVAPQFDTSFQDDRRTPTPPLPAVRHHAPPLAPSAIPNNQPAGTSWNPHPPPIPDNDDDGQRSPSMSTASEFTSISQRGVNPRWQEEQNRLVPGRSQGGLGRHSIGLQGNPDFELPMSRGRAGRGGRGGLLGPGFR
jgi:hypothetical protein